VLSPSWEGFGMLLVEHLGGGSMFNGQGADPYDGVLVQGKPPLDLYSQYGGFHSLRALQRWDKLSHTGEWVWKKRSSRDFILQQKSYENKSELHNLAIKIRRILRSAG
jgi:hypothetical protein